MTAPYHVVRNYTVEPFFPAGCTFGPYGGLAPLDPDAEAYVFFYAVPPLAEAGRAAEEVRSYLDLLRLVQQAVPAGRPLIVLTLRAIRGAGWVEADRALDEAIEAFNALARELAATGPATYCLDLAGFLAGLADGPQAATPPFDWRFYYTYQTPLNPQLATAFQAWFAERREKLAFRRKKLLALDLDGVLWGGVLGEGDAVVGGGYPGNAFLDVQRLAASIKATGTLLAVLSKNERADVEAFFAARPELPLRLDDFVAIACDWQPKAANLQAMLAGLGLGPESVVVLDDSPYEREHLRRAFPEAAVPDLPEAPYALVPAVAAILREHCSAYALTEADRAKTDQYRHKAQADALRAELTYDGYLAHLATTLDVAPLAAASRERFLQLTQKTNQFNLTLLRLTEAELAAREARGEAAFVVAVADRFGSHGVAGAALVSFGADGTRAHLEAFMLSCRVLGRGVEAAFLAGLAERLARRGVRTLTGAFVSGPRNAVAANFLTELGFEPAEGLLAYDLAGDRPLPRSPHLTLTGGPP